MASEMTKRSRRELQEEIKNQGEIVRSLKLEEKTEEVKQKVFLFCALAVMPKVAALSIMSVKQVWSLKSQQVHWKVNTTPRQQS